MAHSSTVCGFNTEAISKMETSYVWAAQTLRFSSAVAPVTLMRSIQKCLVVSMHPNPVQMTSSTIQPWRNPKFCSKQRGSTECNPVSFLHGRVGAKYLCSHSSILDISELRSDGKLDRAC